MNQWPPKAANPARERELDDAEITRVDASQWGEIKKGLRAETARWLQVLKTPREVAGIEFTGLVSSIAHLAYHLGAIRQIDKAARGPREGSF